MNALTLLKNDHATVEGLFQRFEALGDKAKAGRKKVVQQIIRALSVHAAIEEQVFYPAVRRAVKAAEDDVLEALEEHHIVKWLLSELEGMEPDAERFVAKVTVLMENVRHHVQEEEKDLFPQVRKAMSRKDLDALGAAMEAAKKVAPTRPHPRAPDTPPGNVAAGAPAAVLDRAKDAGRALVAKVDKVARGRASSGANGLGAR